MFDHFLRAPGTALAAFTSAFLSVVAVAPGAAPAQEARRWVPDAPFPDDTDVTIMTARYVSSGLSPDEHVSAWLEPILGAPHDLLAPWKDFEEGMRAWLSSDSYQARYIEGMLQGICEEQDDGLVGAFNIWDNSNQEWTAEDVLACRRLEAYRSTMITFNLLFDGSGKHEGEDLVAIKSFGLTDTSGKKSWPFVRLESGNHCSSDQSNGINYAEACAICFDSIMSMARGEEGKLCDKGQLVDGRNKLVVMTAGADWHLFTETWRAIRTETGADPRLMVEFETDTGRIDRFHASAENLFQALFASRDP